MPAVERTLEKLDATQALLSATRKAYHEELAARLLAEAGNPKGTGPHIVNRAFTNYAAGDLQDFASANLQPGGICLAAASDSETGRTSVLFAAAAIHRCP